MSIKKYRFILFDLDETLFDFRKSEAVALTKAFKLYHLTIDDDIVRVYNDLNFSLWKKLEDKKITKDVLVVERFHLLFKKYNIDLDPAAFEDDYQRILSEQAYLMEGAMDICRYLKSKYDLYSISNGVAFTQYNRMRLSGLKALLSGHFVSEEVGYAKPDIRFFKHVSQEIPSFQKEKALVVGDSQSSDIQGANNAGIDVCWYNYRGETLQEGLSVNYCINHLRSLKNFL